MELEELTLEEARELKALTDAIRNLEIIAGDAPPDAELVELNRRTSTIVENLRLIGDADTNELEALERRVASIATALRTIEADEVVRELGAEK